jgi:hypothetical protein
MRSQKDKALIQETQAFWQEQYQCVLFEDEAQQIIGNVTELFNLLERWDLESNTVEGKWD